MTQIGLEGLYGVEIALAQGVHSRRAGRPRVEVRDLNQVEPAGLPGQEAAGLSHVDADSRFCEELAGEVPKVAAHQVDHLGVVLDGVDLA